MRDVVGNKTMTRLRRLQSLRRLHADESGMEVPSMIMLLAFITIPLIIALGGFSKDILKMLSDSTDRLKPGE